jgi:cysteinyl-tRNA synthetase
MAAALLGETIDIHGGGHDLVFPHHENERAQSTCAHGGAVFARYWLHNGFVTLDHQKMAKSVGNVLLMKDLLKQMPGEAVRLALLSGHYRQPLDWSDDVAADAQRKLDRLYGALRELGQVAPEPGVAAPQAFVAALEDDLNTPMALAELFELARAANKAEDAAAKSRLKAQLLDAGSLLGVLQQSPETWFAAARTADGDTIAEAQIEGLIAQRAAAKQAKNYAEADRIRQQLAARGVLLEDSAQGVRWRRA